MSELPMPRTRKVIAEGIEQGLHPGAQVYVSLGGQVVANIAMGQAREGVPMTTDTALMWLSSGKPLTAVAVAQIWERGLLSLDDRVTRYIPEFAVGGKEAITVRHLLTHTGGFRGTPSFQTAESWEKMLAEVCKIRLESGWVPGQKAGYHHGSSWVILAELVHRLDGRPMERYVREEICLPLGMNDTWIGMSPEEYRAYAPRMGFMHLMKPGEAPAASYFGDTEVGMAVCRPGGNTHGPVRDMGRFYEAMLAGGQWNGRRILLPQTMEAMISRHRVRMFDHTFKSEIDWGLGFILHTDMGGQENFPYAFSPHVSPRTFGHGGYQSSAGFADPERQMVVCFVFNGTPGEEAHRVRRRAIQAAIQEDLAESA